MALLIPEKALEHLRAVETYASYYIIGFLLNWGLYGALCTQVYMYYLAFPEDRLLNKILVYGVYFLETAQAMLLLYNGIPIYNFHNLTSTYELPGLDGSVLWTAVPLLGGIVAFIVQSFYAYRLLILARSWVIVVIIVFLALLQLVVTVGGGSALFGGPLPPIVTVPAQLAWGSFSIGCDVIIAIAMTYSLLRNDSGWKSTHTLLVKLVRLAVETGTVTVVVAVAFVALYFGPLADGPEGARTPAIILGKVYSNAMMVNFNHRIQFSGGRDDPQVSALVMASIPLFPNSAIASDRTQEPESDSAGGTLAP